MNPYRERFGSTPRLFVVIHHKDNDRTLANADLAFREGADGVFLIDHDGTAPRPLLRAYLHTRKGHPDGWFGINYLRTRKTAGLAAAHLPIGIDGLWTDDPGIVEDSADQQMVDQTDAILSRHQKSVIHFGGVAFKGQPQPQDLKGMTQLAARHLDVVTTSGPGTGMAIDLKKITTMRAALNELPDNPPLALASGVTETNVGNYLGAVDAFLVATSITDPSDQTLRKGAVESLLQAMGR